MKLSTFLFPPSLCPTVCTDTYNSYNRSWNTIYILLFSVNVIPSPFSPLAAFLMRIIFNGGNAVVQAVRWPVFYLTSPSLSCSWLLRDSPSGLHEVEVAQAGPLRPAFSSTSAQADAIIVFIIKRPL